MSEKNLSLDPKFTPESATEWITTRFYTLTDPIGQHVGLLEDLTYHGSYLKPSEPFGELILPAIIFHAFKATVRNNPTFKSYGLILEDNSREIHAFKMEKVLEYIAKSTDLNQK